MGGMFMAAMRMELAEQAEKERDRRIREGFGIGEYASPAKRAVEVGAMKRQGTEAPDDPK